MTHRQMTTHRQMPHQTIIGLFACLFVLSLSVLAFTGCSSKVEETDDEPVIELTPEERAAADKKRREETMAGYVNKYKKIMIKDPTAFEKNIQNFMDLVPGSKGLKQEKQIQDTVDTLKKKFREFAKAEYEKLLPEIDTHVEEGDFVAAFGALEKFNTTRFEMAQARYLDGEPLEVLDLYVKKRDQITDYSSAESECSMLLRRAESFAEQGEPGRAVAICEAFSDRYKDTPYYQEVRAKIPVYYAQYQEWKQEDDAKEQTPWSDVEVTESLSDFSHRHKPGVDVFSGNGDTITGNNKSEGPAFLVGGESNWMDYYLEFEVMLGDGQDQLIMGIHTVYNIRRKQEDFQIYRIDDMPSDEWQKVRVEAKGGRVRVLDPESGDTLYEGRGTAFRGEYAFVLEAGQTIKVRNLRVKVLSKDDSKEEIDDEEED